MVSLGFEPAHERRPLVEAAIANFGLGDMVEDKAQIGEGPQSSSRTTATEEVRHQLVNEPRALNFRSPRLTSSRSSQFGSASV